MYFIKFDIEAFYPNITRNVLHQAIAFAKSFTTIQEHEVDIIMHSCKTVLRYDGSTWIKKNNPDAFDIPMGSLHGAEVCELIGLYLLDKMKKIVYPGTYGLYRDDGLMVVRKSSCEMERLCKSLRCVFLESGFKITIEKELKRVEFLDVVLDLDRDSYRPYRKPNSETIYMSRSSSHPSYVKKQIPLMVNQRLCALSKSKPGFRSRSRSPEPEPRSNGFYSEPEPEQEQVKINLLRSSGSGLLLQIFQKIKVTF